MPRAAAGTPVCSCIACLINSMYPRGPVKLVSNSNWEILASLLLIAQILRGPFSRFDALAPVITVTGEAW